MPGLVRGMARTAAIVGTATATRNAVDRHSAQKDANAYAQAQANAQAQYAPPPQQQYAPPPQQYAPPPPAAAQPVTIVDQLEELCAQYQQGQISDAQFAAGKTYLLG